MGNPLSRRWNFQDSTFCIYSIISIRMKTVVLWSWIGALVYLELFHRRYKKYPILLTAQEATSPFFNIVDDWTYSFLIKLFPWSQKYFELFALESIINGVVSTKMIRLLLPGIRDHIISSIWSEIIRYTSLDTFEEQKILYDIENEITFDQLIVADWYNENFIRSSKIAPYDYSYSFYRLKNPIQRENHHITNSIYPDGCREWVMWTIAWETHIWICKKNTEDSSRFLNDISSFAQETIDIASTDYEIHLKASLHEAKYDSYHLIASSKWEIPITLSLGNSIAIYDSIHLLRGWPWTLNKKRSELFEFLAAKNTQKQLPNRSEVFEYFHTYSTLS